MLAVEALEAKEKCDKMLDRCWDKILGDYPRWIPCTDRMPEEKLEPKYGENFKGSELVLVSAKDCNGEIFVDMDSTGNGEWLLFEVIAWMPLPKPYKEGEEDD